MQTHQFNPMQFTLMRFQGPIQELADLNLKTIQNLSYLKPEELSGLNRPEELFEKHMNVLIDNGHKSLDYMQKASEIFEKFWFSSMEDFRKNAEKVASSARSATRKGAELTKEATQRSTKQG